MLDMKQVIVETVPFFIIKMEDISKYVSLFLSIQKVLLTEWLLAGKIFKYIFLKE